MEFPRGKFASGASTIVKTEHSRWRREPRNGVLCEQFEVVEVRMF